MMNYLIILIRFFVFFLLQAYYVFELDAAKFVTCEGKTLHDIQASVFSFFLLFFLLPSKVICSFEFGQLM